MTTPMGYELTTTFWQDFSIADAFGLNAIKDTFNRAFEEWKHNYVYLTELVIVLNWKMWDWSEKNRQVGLLYQTLWEKADAYAMNNLKGEEKDFFLRTTD